MCESPGVARGDGQAWYWLIHYCNLSIEHLRILNESHNLKQKPALLLAISLRSHIKQSFHVFDHALKAFEGDKRLGFASAFITFSCFHIMIKHWNPCFVYSESPRLRTSTFKYAGILRDENSLLHSFSLLFCQNLLKMVVYKLLLIST